MTLSLQNILAVTIIFSEVLSKEIALDVGCLELSFFLSFIYFRLFSEFFVVFVNTWQLFSLFFIQSVSLLICLSYFTLTSKNSAVIVPKMRIRVRPRHAACWHYYTLHCAPPRWSDKGRNGTSLPALPLPSTRPSSHHKGWGSRHEGAWQASQASRSAALFRESSFVGPLYRTHGELHKE